jgi:hypothetical protein
VGTRSIWPRILSSLPFFRYCFTLFFLHIFYLSCTNISLLCRLAYFIGRISVFLTKVYLLHFKQEQNDLAYFVNVETILRTLT